MEQKTKINAEAGKQEIMITREFDLPLELLFKAYQEADIVEQWMGTKVLKLESKKHGSYQYETTDAKGNVVFKANGVIHEFSKLTMHTIYESATLRDQVLQLPFAQGIKWAHNRLQEIVSKLG